MEGREGEGWYSETQAILDTFDIVKVDNFDDTLILAIMIEPGIVLLSLKLKDNDNNHDNN